MPRGVLSLVLIILGMALLGQVAATPAFAAPTTAASACAAIANADFSMTPDAPSQIINAKIRQKSDNHPEVCLVNGYVSPTIGFRIWLPTENWNGKFSQTGCGGRCADILNDGCEIVVTRGYACIAADLGHKGTLYDDVWAIDNIPGMIDFGFRATHVTNLIGKAVTTRFYGRKPAYSYYFGASTGGRQGLIEAQRFPADFNGIVAGEPAMNRPGIDQNSAGNALSSAVQAMFVDGKALITPAELAMIHQHVIADCDDDDHLKDGIVSDPLACKFRPADLLCKGPKTPDCLTQTQIEALARIYQAGPLPGSELHWVGAYILPDGSPGRYRRRVANPYLYPYFWAFTDATNPDLRPFKDAGGKLIVYQGWADEATFPLNPVKYYETVEGLMGGRAQTQDFFRLFMIPAEGHIPAPGGVGNGAETVDYLTALENWVEHGQAPDKLIGYHLKSIGVFAGPVIYGFEMRPDNIAFSRPVYPYPVQARYLGQGNPDDAPSFGPYDPTAHK
jgi:hypothetical protein